MSTIYTQPMCMYECVWRYVSKWWSLPLPCRWVIVVQQDDQDSILSWTKQIRCFIKVALNFIHSWWLIILGIGRRMAGMKEELKKAWQFLRSIEFWRMAVLWNLSILYSYLLLFSRSFLSFSINHRSETNYSDKSVSPCTSEAVTPLCIITGVKLLVTFML